MPLQDAFSFTCYRPQQRDDDVNGLSPQAVLCTLDIDGTMLYSCDILRHHAPDEAGKFLGDCCFCDICFLAFAKYKFIVTAP